MNGWCKFTEENSDKVIIEYSLGANNSCDGKLSWSKSTQEITVMCLSNGATSMFTRHFICAVRGRIRRGFEFNRLYYLAV